MTVTNVTANERRFMKQTKEIQKFCNGYPKKEINGHLLGLYKHLERDEKISDRCVLYFTYNLMASSEFLFWKAAIESSSSIPKLLLRCRTLSAPAAAAPGTVNAAFDTKNENLYYYLKSQLQNISRFKAQVFNVGSIFA